MSKGGTWGGLNLTFLVSGNCHVAPKYHVSPMRIVQYSVYTKVEAPIR